MGDLSGDHQNAPARGHPAQAGHPPLSGRKVKLACAPALPGEAVGGQPEHRGAHEIVTHRAHVLAHCGEPATRLRQRPHAVAADQWRDARPEPPGAAVGRRPRRVRPQRQPSSVATGNHQRHPPAGRGAQDRRLPRAAAIGRREDQRACKGKRGLRAHRHHRAAVRGHPGERGPHLRRGGSARPGELPIGESGGRVRRHQPGRAVADCQPAGDDHAGHRHGEHRHAGNGPHQDRTSAAARMRAAGPGLLPGLPGCPAELPGASAEPPGAFAKLPGRLAGRRRGHARIRGHRRWHDRDRLGALLVGVRRRPPRWPLPLEPRLAPRAQ
jgi:hypothetical protein